MNRGTWQATVHGVTKSQTQFTTKQQQTTVPTSDMVFALVAGHTAAAAAATKSLQSCPTLCNPTDGSPPGPSVHGSFQARALEWGVPLPSPADHTGADHIVHLRRAFCSVSNIFHLKGKKALMDIRDLILIAHIF